MALTKEQAQEANRAAKTDQFLTDNHDLVDGYDPMKEEFVGFTTNLANLQAATGQKNVDGTGITDDKTMLKHEFAEDASILCDKVWSYATKNKKMKLAAEVNLREEHIFKMKDMEILPFAKKLQDDVAPLLNDPLFKSYGVVDADLTGLVTTATTFNGLIGKAKVEESVATVGNTEINDAIKLLRANYVQMDRLMSHYKKANPKFVEGYHINNAVDKVGIRHSGIEGLVKDSLGQPVAAANIQLKGTTYHTTTDLNGVYRLDKIVTNDYIVEVSAEHFISAEVLHHITRGKIDTLDFVLTRLVP